MNLYTYFYRYLPQTGKQTKCGVKIQYFALDDLQCKYVLKKDVRPNLECGDVIALDADTLSLSGHGLASTLTFGAGDYVRSMATYDAVGECEASVNEGYTPSEKVLALTGGCAIVTCFAGTELVHLQGGLTKMISDVAIGDTILSASTNGTFVFSNVIALAHPKNSISARFVSIQTDIGYSLLLTEDHILPTVPCVEYADSANAFLQKSHVNLIRASSAQVGMCVRTTQGYSRIIGIDISIQRGVYSVVTNEV